MEMPPLGRITFYRTTREAATGQGGPIAQLTDFGLATLIPLKRTIAQPHNTKSAVYRITLKGDDQVATAFAQDERQQVKKVAGNTLELHVRALRAPGLVENAGEPKEEYLQSCYYLKSDDTQIKNLARQAVGSETDPWKKAQRIERWVHTKMKIDNSVPFAPADQVARDLRGDCRQHAMLTAALCRAAGVPSRTAVGLVYVNDRQRGPVLGFHMWTEVWVKGQWLGIDATLGQGSVGAAHIKISDHSWNRTESLTPLLPVARVLGKIAVEVVSVN
jgi:transglutaminase-like putative cysteine protease